MKILLTILLLSISSFAQKWEFIGTSSQNEQSAPIAYFVDTDSVERKDDTVTFKGMIALIYQKKLNPSFLLVSDFMANCKTKKWQELNTKGRWNGDPVDEKFDKPVERTADDNSMMFLALDTICGEKKGVIRAE